MEKEDEGKCWTCGHKGYEHKELSCKELSEMDNRKKIIEDFEKVSNPVIKFINDRFNPHTYVIIDCDSAQILEAKISSVNKQFIKD